MKLTTSPRTSSLSPTREELTSFMPLVHRVVARMLRRLPPNVLRDDLVAAGSYGLVDALRKSPTAGPRSSGTRACAFAVRWSTSFGRRTG